MVSKFRLELIED